ncbi:MAG: hypothetical protein ACI30R_05860 [Sodaliphilus sp.]
MNNKDFNPAMNADDYENMAVQKSNNAKRLAAGGALFVGGAAAAGAAAYVATDNEAAAAEEDANDALTADNIVDAGNVADNYQPHVETESSERMVYVEREAPAEQSHATEHQSESHDDANPQVTWDEKTVVYDVNGNVLGSEESGTVQGHKFSLIDSDGDDKADYLAIDVNDNGVYEADEIVKYDPSDNVLMGHETTHTKELHYDNLNTEDHNQIAQNDDEKEPIHNNFDDEKQPIHNNFEDEKTGESYRGDFADNNRDYNPNADVDYGKNSNEYLADNHFEENDDQVYAGVSDEFYTEADTDINNDADLAYEEDDDTDIEVSDAYAENTDDSYADMTDDDLIG